MTLMSPIETSKDLYNLIASAPNIDVTDVAAFENSLGERNIDGLVGKCSKIILDQNGQQLSFQEVKFLENWFTQVKDKIRLIKENEEDVELSKKNFFTRIVTYCWRLFFGRSTGPKIKELEQAIQSDIEHLKSTEQSAWESGMNTFVKSGNHLLYACKAAHKKDSKGAEVYEGCLDRRPLLNNQLPEDQHHTDPKEYWNELFLLLPASRDPNKSMAVPFNSLGDSIINTLVELSKKYYSLLGIEYLSPASARAFIYSLLSAKTPEFLFPKDMLLIAFIKEFVSNPTQYFTPNEEQQNLCTELSRAIAQIETGEF